MSGVYGQAYNYDVTARLGVDHEERFDLRPDDTGVQPVITGSKLLMDIKPAGGGAVIALRSETGSGLVIAGDGRSFTLSITRAQFAALGVGSHDHELLIERADGKRFLIWTGRIMVEVGL